MKHADKLDLLRSYALNEWPGPALILRTNSKGTVLHMEEISLQIWNWSRGMTTTTTKLLQDKKGFFFFFFAWLWNNIRWSCRQSNSKCSRQDLNTRAILKAMHTWSNCYLTKQKSTLLILSDLCSLVGECGFARSYFSD